jgi:hypothetical protein
VWHQSQVVFLAKEGSSFQITRSKACVLLAKQQSSRGIFKECKGADGSGRGHDMLNPSCFYSRCKLGQDFLSEVAADARPRVVAEASHILRHCADFE